MGLVMGHLKVLRLVYERLAPRQRLAFRAVGDEVLGHEILGNAFSKGDFQRRTIITLP